MAISRPTEALGANKPLWLYELLPAIYIAAGILVGVSLHGALAILSGSLLMAAGIQVFRMRRNYRKAPRRSRRVQLQGRI